MEALRERVMVDSENESRFEKNNKNMQVESSENKCDIC